MKNKDELAFPQLNQNGLTKREWFAGLALQALLSRNNLNYDGIDDDVRFSKFAYHYADAMLDEKNSGEVK